MSRFFAVSSRAHRLIVFSFGCFLMFGATGEIRGALVGYWPLDGNVLDRSLSGNDGTLSGAPSFVSDVPAQLGGGMAISLAPGLDQVNGIGDYVDLGPALEHNFSTGNFTISAWIKTTQTSRGTIFGNGGDDGGGIRNVLSVGEANANGATLTTDDNSTKRQARNDIPVNDGDWHHVLALRDGDQTRVYVDGVLSGGNATQTLPAGYDLSGTSQKNSYIGVGRTQDANRPEINFQKHFEGLIDDVALWDEALDLATIQGLADGSISPNPIPEPSTLLLAALGLLGLAGGARRSRRRQHAPAGFFSLDSRKTLECGHGPRAHRLPNFQGFSDLFILGQEKMLAMLAIWTRIRACRSGWLSGVSRGVSEYNQTTFKVLSGRRIMSLKRKSCLVSLLSLAVIVALSGPAFGDHITGITTFSYTQTDVSTGSGTIAAPANSNFGGVDITWTPTAMPAAWVFDPTGAGSAGGAVGGWNAQTGSGAENDQDVRLYWNETADIAGAKSIVTVVINGTGSNGSSYELPIELKFFGDNVLPDEHFTGWGNNDYQWSLEYGGNGVTGTPRTGIWLSPTWAPQAIAAGGGNRNQRYTQNQNELGGGILTNTDTSSGAEKDAFDQDGNTTQFAAIGQPLEIGFGWRDRESVSGTVLVDNFNFRGLLEYDDANIVPEPSTFLLAALGMLGAAMMRRRRR